MSTARASDTAVVLAAHGDRGAGFTNAALLAHRQILEDAGCFAAVTAGVLKGDPPLETALASAQASGAARIAVYPFFFADGFFVRTRLAERVAAAGLTTPWDLLPPLGIDPGLPDLMRDHASAAAGRAGFTPAQATLLVVGHGSKFGPASADATRAAASAIAENNAFAAVTTAFLEEPPSIADALRSLAAPVVVSGFFAGEGLHAGEDVPAAIAASGLPALYAGPIGNDPSVSRLILRRISA